VATYSKQMQAIVEAYRNAGEPWPAAAKTMAAWAILTSRWQLPPAAAINKCAEDLATAMREDFGTDAKGRRVRLMHPAHFKKGGENYVLWDDMRTATREHMQLSFQQRRRGIVGDCRQLKVDVDSYNDMHSENHKIQLILDFEMDIAEIEAAAA
jgi:hypothetical protein